MHKEVRLFLYLVWFPVLIEISLSHRILVARRTMKTSQYACTSFAHKPITPSNVTDKDRTGGQTGSSIQDQMLRLQEQTLARD